MNAVRGNYSGKSAVITGGGSGIGFAIAKLLVDGGARVVITGRSQCTLDDARERLDAGATLLQGWTGLVYGGPLWPARLQRGLARRPSAAEPSAAVPSEAR